MTTRLTLGDLELPDGALEGFTPEQIADVERAAADGANARIAQLLGQWTADDLDALPLWSVLYDENCDPYVKGPTAWMCTGGSGTCTTEEMLERSRDLELDAEQTAIAQASYVKGVRKSQTLDHRMQLAVSL